MARKKGEGRNDMTSQEGAQYVQKNPRTLNYHLKTLKGNTQFSKSNLLSATGLHCFQKSVKGTHTLHLGMFDTRIPFEVIKS